MIKKLDNNSLEISHQIQKLFQSSYAVEAKLLGAIDFPPLKRPLDSYQNSDTTFFGYIKNDQLAGVIEIEQIKDQTSINSLVVDPIYFRRGIARQLIEFVFKTFSSKFYSVETGAKNEPATDLYIKLGFKEVKQWDTDFGIRKILLEKHV